MQKNCNFSWRILGGPGLRFRDGKKGFAGKDIMRVRDLMGTLFPSPGGLFPRGSPPGTGGEPRRVERVLATVRLVLAVSALVAIYYDPTPPSPYDVLAYAPPILYLAYAISVYFSIRGSAALSSWELAATP